MRPKILLIEDNEQNRYLIEFLVTQHGFDIECAPDGERGIARAAGERFDLILLDIQLPTMDGYTVARHLRSNPSLSQVPIIAVTSYAMVGDRERTFEAGCNGYIEKPIDPETFVDEIRQFLPVAPMGGVR